MKQRIITGIIVVLIMIPILLFAQTPVLPIALAIGSVIAMFEMLRCIGMQKAWALPFRFTHWQQACLSLSVICH